MNVIKDTESKGKSFLRLQLDLFFEELNSLQTVPSSFIAKGDNAAAESDGEKNLLLSALLAI